MIKKFGIIGNPIRHSLSPVLHNYWFKKYSIDATYSIIDVDLFNNLLKSVDFPTLDRPIIKILNKVNFFHQFLNEVN